jgi:urease accessory protein
MSFNTAMALAASIVSVSMAAPAAAHTGAVGGMIAGGFSAGFLHPFHGLDHLLAMVAVGLWAALIGGGAVRLLPFLFPSAMVGGAAIAMAGIGLPEVETGIALSVCALGLAVALALRPAAWVAGGLIAVFAIFHGHAHGTELPAAVSASAYAGGFFVATIALHLLGAAVGVRARQGTAGVVARLAGVAIAAGGMTFL